MLDETKEPTNGERKRNCLNCKEVPCTDFYRKGNADFEGGEIYVLQMLTTHADEKKVFPCNVGDVIYTACKLWNFLDDTSPLGDLPSKKIFPQCIRDLRASAYLLLSCHYRSSIQLLRPVIENCLVGIYWDSRYFLAMKQHKEEQVKQEFSLFEKGKFKISPDEWKEVYPKKSKQVCPNGPNQVCPKKPEQKDYLDYRYCLKWIIAHNGAKREEVIPIFFEKDELSETWGKLNDYIHSNVPRYETVIAN